MIGRLFWKAAHFADPLLVRARAPHRAKLGLALPIDREGFHRLIGSAGPILEIGPFEAAFVTGPMVRYFDVLGEDDLRRRAVEHGRDPAGVRPIDYVSPTGDLGIIEDRFETIVSSHVIEHQPDLIRHLAAVERLLVPGGRYAMIVPDKRYCFDHFTAETLLGDVVEAHLEERTTHGTAAVLAQLYETHNDPRRHWTGRHGARPDAARIAAEMPRRMAEVERSQAGDYVDVHAWRFTPGGFAEIVAALAALGYHNLTIEAVHDTAIGEQEFFAFLKRPS